MRALVTGGAGFLGRALVERLLREGHTVRSASRRAYPELEALGAESVVADVTDAKAVLRAADGCDTVFHVAALAGVWGRRMDYVRTNVIGTRNVLAACHAEGVRSLVFTSSPSVCFDGKDHRLAGNDLPYSKRFLAAYPETKAVAERDVLAANGSLGGELATCALRPHLIFGPRDPHLVPRLLDRARRGKLAIVGDGQNEVSLTWVHDGALAHVRAAEALAAGGAAAPNAGKAYFIAQADPIQLWEWIGYILRRLDLPQPTKRVGRGTAESVGLCLELLWRTLPLPGEPPMTRFVAGQLATSHSYDLEPARRDFGYEEELSLTQATELLVDSLVD